MKNIKILFLIAGLKDKNIKIYETASISYLTSFLREKGYDVTISNEKEDGINYSEIDRLKPDIICFSSNFWAISHAYSSFIEWLKDKDVKPYICSGTGDIPKSMAKNILEKYTLIDSIIPGEPELTWLELLECMKNNKAYSSVKGLVYRKNEEIIENESASLFDINELPFASTDIFKSNNTFPVIRTSRGCTGNCSFCTQRQTDKKWRSRDIKTVVDEIEYLVREHKAYFIQFADLSFEDADVNCNRLKNILEEIINRRLFIRFAASFRGDFYKKATPELMELIVKAGLYSVFIGVEAANEDDLKLYHKKITEADCHKTVELFREYGVYVNIGFINFNPYSTIERLRKNIDFLEKYGFATLRTAKNYCKIYPGSNIYNQTVRDGLYSPEGKKYIFMDDKVSELFDFINTYMSYLREQNVNAEYLDSLSFKEYLFREIVFYSSTRQTEKYELASAYYQRQDFILYTLNTYIANWFRELLNLVEKGWDKDVAGELSLKILSTDMLQTSIDIMKRDKEKYEREIKDIKIDKAS